jgi:3D-(3,5/4)-trihydroxycyclohexane-1,2-dione acylhydrolase (decyclizing)
MGYEIAGAWGVSLAYEISGRSGSVISMVGDGSYLMMNSEILSAVNNGNSIIYILCDNKGFAVIQRLQISNGSKSYRTMFADSDLDKPFEVDFVAHANSLGAKAKRINIDNLQDEFLQAKKNSGVSVLVIDTHPTEWTEGGAFWEVGVSGSSSDSQIQSAHKRQVDGKANRRL